jgi:GTPase SAR1 family protein
MGGNSSKKEFQEQDNQVDIDLIDEQITTMYNFKILLLGAGESGKSTVVKQLKAIHKMKPDKEELMVVGDSLHQNAIDCILALFAATDRFEYKLTEEEEKTRKMIQERKESHLSREEGERILDAFMGESIQKAYERRNEFWLLDSWPYYVANMERFTEESWVPSEEDSVMARIRTTGIIESDLRQNIIPENGSPDYMNFKVVDVGGQRNERKKWIHCFDDVKCILFIVNLGGYNQVLFEDNSKNRMVESLELFSSIINNVAFKNTPIFVFLNKKDIFEELVTKVDMKNTFPEYEGGLNVNAALDFIKAEFRKKLPKGKTVEFAAITARVKQEVKGVFFTVKDEIYGKNKKELLAQVAELRKRQDQLVQLAKQNRAGGNTGCCG